MTPMPPEVGLWRFDRRLRFAAYHDRFPGRPAVLRSSHLEQRENPLSGGRSGSGVCAGRRPWWRDFRSADLDGRRRASGCRVPGRSSAHTPHAPRPAARFGRGGDRPAAGRRRHRRPLERHPQVRCAFCAGLVRAAGGRTDEAVGGPRLRGRRRRRPDQRWREPRRGQPRGGRGSRRNAGDQRRGSRHLLPGSRRGGRPVATARASP